MGPVKWIPRFLAFLLTLVGLNYFLLASTAPLIQAWYARRYPDRSPYRLYAWSNARLPGGADQLSKCFRARALVVLAIIGKRIFLDFRRPATGHANLVSGVGSAEMDQSSG